MFAHHINSCLLLLNCGLALIKLLLEPLSIIRYGTCKTKLMSKRSMQEALVSALTFLWMAPWCTSQWARRLQLSRSPEEFAPSSLQGVLDRWAAQTACDDAPESSSMMFIDCNAAQGQDVESWGILWAPARELDKAQYAHECTHYDNLHANTHTSAYWHMHTHMWQVTAMLTVCCDNKWQPCLQFVEYHMHKYMSKTHGRITLWQTVVIDSFGWHCHLFQLACELGSISTWLARLCWQLV